MTLAIDSGPGFTVAWVQPLRVDLDYADGLLQHPKLEQLIVLQASFLGRRLLPEWNSQRAHNLAPERVIRVILAAGGGWSSREVTIGNLHSLWWGFLGGRLLAMNRPHLADRAYARMRRHLFPAAKGKSAAYIKLIRATRDDRHLAGANSDSYHRRGG